MIIIFYFLFSLGQIYFCLNSRLYFTGKIINNEINDYYLIHLYIMCFIILIVWTLYRHIITAFIVHLLQDTKSNVTITTV